MRTLLEAYLLAVTSQLLEDLQSTALPPLSITTLTVDDLNITVASGAADAAAANGSGLTVDGAIPSTMILVTSGQPTKV